MSKQKFLLGLVWLCSLFMSVPNTHAGTTFDPEGVGMPMVAVSPIARSGVHLDLGMGSYNQAVNDKIGNHLSTAFAVGYEYGGEILGFNLRIPFGLAKSNPAGERAVETWMLGDIHMRFRWRVMSLKKTKSYLSIGFELTLPSTLLNTLGGKRLEIFGRRSKDPLYRAGGTSVFTGGSNDFNMLPIRYLGISPQVAFAQKLGNLSFGAHVLVSIYVASDQANLYEYPHPEVILSYDLYAVYDFTKNKLFEAILEINGNSEMTQVASDRQLVSGSHALGFLVGARTRFQERFEAALGFQYNLPLNNNVPGKIKRGYDLSTYYRHDWSILFRFNVLL